MFTDHPKCQQIADKVYIFKQFFSKEEVEYFNNLLSNPDNQHSNRSKDHVIEWFEENKETPAVMESHLIWEKMSELIYPEYSIHPQLSFMISRAGEKGMFIHSDSPGNSMCRGDDHSECAISSEDRWQTCCILDYGIISYFGDFTGGKVYYPHIYKDGTPRPDEEQRDEEDCLEIQPEPGDIVIHGATHPWEHGVRDVDTGIRYAFANFMLLTEKNPGTFYNYKSPEYYERIKDLGQWVYPLKENPLFKDGLRVIPHKK